MLNFVTIHCADSNCVDRLDEVKCVSFEDSSNRMLSREEQILNDLLEHELSYLRFKRILGDTHLVEHTIKLIKKEPILQKYYPKNSAMQQVINGEVDHMLAEVVIEVSPNPCCSPVVLVKKRTGFVSNSND